MGSPVSGRSNLPPSFPSSPYILRTTVQERVVHIPTSPLTPLPPTPNTPLFLLLRPPPIPPWISTPSCTKRTWTLCRPPTLLPPPLLPRRRSSPAPTSAHTPFVDALSAVSSTRYGVPLTSLSSRALPYRSPNSPVISAHTLARNPSSAPSQVARSASPARTSSRGIHAYTTTTIQLTTPALQAPATPSTRPRARQRTM